MSGKDDIVDECACGEHDAAEDIKVHVEGAKDEAAQPDEHKEEPQKTELDECQDMLKRTMADYENMMRQKDHDIESRVGAQVGSVLADVLQIHEDVARAHDTFAASGADASGLAAILKNSEALLERHNVREIDALGERFDPAMHESVAVINDDTLEEGTVTKVLRKGYVCKDRVLRVSLVEISKRVSA